jgi:hypothetical protein
LSVACSLKLSSRNADCSFERRSFLRDEPPSSSSLAREHARSEAAAWPRADESVGKEPALMFGDDDTTAPPPPASSSPAAPPAHDGARFTSTPRVDASKCPADHTRTHRFISGLATRPKHKTQNRTNPSRHSPVSGDEQGRPRLGTMDSSVSRTGGSGEDRPHLPAPNSSSLLKGVAASSRSLFLLRSPLSSSLLTAPIPIPSPSTRPFPASAIVSPKLNPNSILPGTSQYSI